MSSYLRGRVVELQGQIDELKVQVAEILTGIGGEVITGTVSFTADTPLSDVLEPDLVTILKGVKLTSVEQIRETGDEKLLAITGIGPARLKVIREATA